MLTRVELKENIGDIFDKAQVSAAYHQRGVAELIEICKLDIDEVFPIIRKCIYLTIANEASEREVSNVRATDFIALFCEQLTARYKIAMQEDAMESEADESDDDIVDHPIVFRILKYLIKKQQVVADDIRLQACQLLNKIMNSFKQLEVSVTICSLLERKLLHRLNDPKDKVRREAVLVLVRLQDKHDENNPVIGEFCRILQGERNAKIRELVAKTIAVCRKSLPLLIEKIRDVDPAVRLAALKRCSKWPSNLRIETRLRILLAAFLDISPKVTQYIPELILSWFHAYNDNIFDLLKSVRLETDTYDKDIKLTTKCFQIILDVMFEKKTIKELTEMLPLNERKLIPYDLLTWERVAYWKIYAEFLNKSENYQDQFDEILPELVYFCEYIYGFLRTIPNDMNPFEFVQYQFIISQLFSITKLYDLGDPVSRESLNELVKHMLEKQSLNQQVTQTIVENLENTITHIDRRSEFVCAIIAEISNPMDEDLSSSVSDYDICKLEVRLVSLNVDLEESINAENYNEAERLKNEIVSVKEEIVRLKTLKMSIAETSEIRTDLPTLLKCLHIAGALLHNVTYLCPTLESLKCEVIAQYLIHPNDTIKAAALRCYCLCSIVDKYTAINAIHIFCVPIMEYMNNSECSTHVLEVCLQAVSDLLRVYGSNIIADPDTNQLSESGDEEHIAALTGGTSLSDTLAAMLELMQNDEFDVQYAATLGLASMTLSGRMGSPVILAHLILKWCNPTTEYCIQQMLGVFLEDLLRFPGNDEQLEESVLLVVKSLYGAPSNSPLSEVDIDNIAKFMVSLCYSTANAAKIHANLATNICDEMLKHPKRPINLIWSRMLLLLSVSGDESFRERVEKLCDDVRNILEDRNTIRNVVKFLSTLHKPAAREAEVVAEPVKLEDSEE